MLSKGDRISIDLVIDMIANGTAVIHDIGKTHSEKIVELGSVFSVMHMHMCDLLRTREEKSWDKIDGNSITCAVCDQQMAMKFCPDEIDVDNPEDSDIDVPYLQCPCGNVITEDCFSTID